jgi:hypothetical protein
MIEVKGEQLENCLVALISKEGLSPEERFVVAKFVARCKSDINGPLFEIVHSMKNKSSEAKTSVLSLTEEVIRENFVLKNYNMDSS